MCRATEGFARFPSQLSLLRAGIKRGACRAGIHSSASTSGKGGGRLTQELHQAYTVARPSIGIGQPAASFIPLPRIRECPPLPAPADCCSPDPRGTGPPRVRSEAM